jgi:hypothetical protein
MSEDRYDVIERLWESSGHGTTRQDIERAYDAGYDALAARLAEAELTLRSIALSSCCGDCQEAKRVAQSYFGAAVSASPVSTLADPGAHGRHEAGAMSANADTPNAETRAAMEEARGADQPAAAPRETYSGAGFGTDSTDAEGKRTDQPSRRRDPAICKHGLLTTVNNCPKCSADPTEAAP